jgi:hypothetical protein
MAVTKRDEFPNVIQVEFGRTRTSAISQRLRRATQEMEEGVRIQRREVENFRAEVRKLDAEIKNLGRTLVTFRDNMARVDVMPLRRKALRLARIMRSAEQPTTVGSGFP